MRHALLIVAVIVSPTFAAPPVQDSVDIVLGPKRFRDGDVVHLTDVTATSPRLEQGDTVIVRGRVRLDSQRAAQLGFYLTQTSGDGTEETDAAQTVSVKAGLQDFELQTTIKHQGVLHLTFYDQNSGKPFGGTYFGTREQMSEIARWKLDYYLNN